MKSLRPCTACTALRCFVIFCMHAPVSVYQANHKHRNFHVGQTFFEISEIFTCVRVFPRESDKSGQNNFISRGRISTLNPSFSPLSPGFSSLSLGSFKLLRNYQYKQHRSISMSVRVFPRQHRNSHVHPGKR